MNRDHVSQGPKPNDRINNAVVHTDYVSITDYVQLCTNYMNVYSAKYTCVPDHLMSTENAKLCTVTGRIYIKGTLRS